MKKIIITIFVPNIEDEFDMKISINSNMKEVLDLIQKGIRELSGDTYVINPNALLYEKNTGKVINLNNVVKYSGLQNGSSVMLF